MVQGRRENPGRGRRAGKMGAHHWQHRRGRKSGREKIKCFQATKGSQLPGKLELLPDEPDLLSFPLRSLPGLESRESQAQEEFRFHSKVAKNEYQGIC